MKDLHIPRMRERISTFLLNTISPIFHFSPKNLINYFTFFLKEYFKYRKMVGAEKLNFLDSHPIVYNKTSTTPFESHYFYQSAWASRKIAQIYPVEHIDIGSQIDFINVLSAFVKTIFIDLRPLKTNLSNLHSKKGTILKIPYEDNTVKSLSCLHVAEHIGLGRYGDPLDPYGTEKAIEELKRVLSFNGDLYFSLPIGRERVCFNAHRIHNPKTIVKLFKPLKLVEFSCVNDNSQFIINADLDKMGNLQYGCGLFHFSKQ